MKVYEIFDRHEFTNIDKLPGVKKKHSAQDIADIIKANCSEMLSAMKMSNRALMRGTASYRDESIKATMTAIRQDRRPVEMSRWRHDDLIEIFKKFNLKAHRGNSIFCTTSLSVASNWGTPSIIFVKDGWTGTVFDAVKTDYAFNKLQSLVNYYEDEEPKALKLFEKLKPRSFDTASELGTILSKKYYDILITGDSYMALSLLDPLGYTSENTLEILQLLGLSEEIFKK